MNIFLSKKHLYERFFRTQPLGEGTVRVREVTGSQQIRAPLIYWEVYFCIKFPLTRVSLGPQGW